MPCDGEYLNQNGQEAELQETAKLLAWVLLELGELVPPPVTNAANEYYCTRTWVVPELCKYLRRMPGPQRTAMLKKNDLMGGGLREWWKQHAEADRQRRRKTKES